MTSKVDNVLVIGGCGFLGHHIVKLLLESKSSKISVLDLRTTRNRFPGVTYYNGDITSSTDVKRVFEEVKPEVIIHTASPIVNTLVKDQNIYYKVNVEGTQNLLDCAVQSGYVKAFVYTSSASVISDGEHDVRNGDETWPVLRGAKANDYYSHTKGIADELVQASNRKNGSRMLTATIRPAGIFGEGDVQMLLGLLEVYHDGKHIYQLGDNKSYFDFTYVGNVAHAHILAAKHLLSASSSSTPLLSSQSVEGQAFFVTNDEPWHFWDFAQRVWRAAGDTSTEKDRWVIPKNVALVIATLLEWIYWIVFWGTKQPLFTTQKVKPTCLYRTFNIEKAKTRLGYRPLTGMEEGIQRGMAWFETPEGKALLEGKKMEKLGKKEQ
ncbi:MAG: erg26, C-3 sterol dehydrogenase [Icmadophila ericetorum]|nr:erg26, C-3 sterol dehydrogenase [Icmadophila ericetorum]